MIRNWCVEHAWGRIKMRQINRDIMTNYKMYKKGKIWLFSAVAFSAGILGTTTVARADTKVTVNSISPTTMMTTSHRISTSTVSNIILTTDSDSTVASSTSAGANETKESTQASSNANSSMASSAVDSTQASNNANSNMTSSIRSANSSVSKKAVSTSNKAVMAKKSTQKSAEELLGSIFSDELLKQLGIDVKYIHENNALGIASLFHIFANSTTLNADTNGNIATIDLISGATDFGTRGYEGDLYYIANLLGALLANSFRGDSSIVHVGNTVSVGSENGQAVINDTTLTNVTDDQIFKDSDSNVYINIEAYFELLRKKAAYYYDQVTSNGIIYDFSDMNNRTIDVSKAYEQADGEKYIYANIPLSILQASQSLYITGVKTDGPTLIINVIDDLKDIAEGTQINLETKTEIQVDGKFLSSSERTKFEDSVILWNFGDDHLKYNFVMAGRFVGSILAPNAEIIGNVNIDGNIVADHVCINNGESHRFDLQNPEPSEEPTDPEESTDPEEPTDFKVSTTSTVFSKSAETERERLAKSVNRANSSVTSTGTLKDITSSANISTTSDIKLGAILPQTGDNTQQSVTIWGLVTICLAGVLGLLTKTLKSKKKE